VEMAAVRPLCASRMHAQTRTSAQNAQAHLPKGSARQVMTSAHQPAPHLPTAMDSNGPPEPSLHLEAGPQSPPSPSSLDPTAGSQPRTACPSSAQHTSRSLALTMKILVLLTLAPSPHLETGPQSPPSPPSLDPTAGSQPRTAGPSCTHPGPLPPP
jgi:hypothetical protein